MSVMFFFFSPPNLRAPSADRRETLPHDRKLTEFYNAGPKIAKTMQNFGRFYATFDFDRDLRISPERLKIRKIGKKINREQFVLRSIKKGPVNFGPLVAEN